MHTRHDLARAEARILALAQAGATAAKIAEAFPGERPLLAAACRGLVLSRRLRTAAGSPGQAPETQAAG